MSAGILAMKINEKVLMEATSGVSVAELAKKYGVSQTMIRIRIKNGRIECNERPQWKGLSRRVCNCLDAAGFTSADDVIEKFSKDPASFLKIRNFGRDSFIELEAWIGRSENEPTQITVRAKLKEIKSLIIEVERLLKQLSKEGN